VLDHGLCSIRVDAETITPDPRLGPIGPWAAGPAGLPRSPDVQIHPPATTAATHSHNDHRFAAQLDRQDTSLIARAIP
jgi:hypothetical protein